MTVIKLLTSYNKCDRTVSKKVSLKAQKVCQKRKTSQWIFPKSFCKTILNFSSVNWISTKPWIYCLWKTHLNVLSIELTKNHLFVKFESVTHKKFQLVNEQIQRKNKWIFESHMITYKRIFNRRMKTLKNKRFWQ